MNNEYDSDELSKLLILYLQIKDCGKNDRVLFESMFGKGVMMPTDQIRTPSSDWKESMGSFSKFLSVGRDEQKAFKKSSVALTTYKDRSKFKRNTSLLNGKEAKTAAIASVDGGGNITVEVGWEADDAGGRNDAEDDSDDDDGVEDGVEDVVEDVVADEGARDINPFPANTDTFLLKMYLTFAHVGGNNQRAIVALFKRPRGYGKSVMPAARERHSSSD